MSAPVTSYDEQMQMGRLHARSDAFRQQLEWARAGVDAMLEVAPRSYVSLSFGKQSICLAHLVMRCWPGVPMYFLASTETWALYDYGRVVEEFVTWFQPNLTIVQTNRLGAAASWEAGRDAGDRDLQEMCDRASWDGWFLGLSFDESRQRRITLAEGARQRNAHPSIYRYADGKYRCCPIATWDTRDLAAYIGQHNLPLLNIYQRYGLTQRTTARMTKQMVRQGAMALARLTSGPALSELANRYPEVKVR